MEHSDNGGAIMESLNSYAPEIIRAGGQEWIQWYAAVWYTPQDPGSQYELFPGAYERIHKNAFDDVLRTSQNIEALYNHNRHDVMGDTDSKTLFLTPDEIGLRAAVPYDATDPVRSKARAKLTQNVVKGGSFRANFNHEPEKTDKGWILHVRHVDKLTEVSLVHKPAYTSARADQVRERIKEEEERIRRILRAKEL